MRIRKMSEKISCQTKVKWWQLRKCQQENHLLVKKELALSLSLSLQQASYVDTFDLLR